ncbi:MAG: hypothetical protein AUJ98_00785 [Bacteroidetes bacterium CG2_30_33_31]|nr:MAG: hypothetical protein AUJ98_00785 [Bacteroidetes bacterium CG2_30_33_31]
MLIVEWIRYALKSKNAFKIHSPFVYDFYNNCFKSKTTASSQEIIKSIRKELLNNHIKIFHNDLGAGSKTLSKNNLSISALAKSSLKNINEASFISRIIQFTNAKTVVELGTSFGTTALLINLENPETELFTIEGSQEIANVAKKIFDSKANKNLHLLKGNFDEIFPELMNKIKNADAFIFDGNHRYEATLRYFEIALKYSKNNSVFIFDDIRWSEEMLNAWKEIKANKNVTITLDFFTMGVIFISSGFSKQNFSLRK